MPNRIIRDGLNDSRAFNVLSDDGQILYSRLILLVDDYGRYEADPDLLRGKLFARILDRWPRARVGEALTEVSRVLTDDGHPLVTVYDGNNGKKYLQINKFRQRIRAEQSKCPAPVGLMSVNWQSDDGLPHASRARAQSESESYSSSESESKTESYSESETTCARDADANGEPATTSGPLNPPLPFRPKTKTPEPGAEPEPKNKSPALIKTEADFQARLAEERRQKQHESRRSI